jgi:tight adherence protein B
VRIEEILLGAGFGLGLWLLVTGVRRQLRPTTAPGSGRLARMARGRGPVQLAAALVAAAVVAVATGWPVGGLLAAIAVSTLPGTLLGAERGRQQRLQRLEGIATWTESLVATLSGAAGLEQTIIATAYTAPTSIRGPVVFLAEDLRDGVRLPDSLRRFSFNLADPVGETVIAALLLASREGAGRLAEPLSLLATAAREDVAAQRRVEKSRAKATTDARLIIMVTLAMAVGLVVFNRGYLHPYDSAVGQVVLAIVGGLFAVGFRWLHKLAQHKEVSRVLDLGAEPRDELTAAPVGTLATVGVVPR